MATGRVSMVHPSNTRIRLDHRSIPSPPPLPPDASVGKQWRFRRNLVIYVAYRNGLSQRLLADVFDLPRSRISEIIKEFRRFEGS